MADAILSGVVQKIIESLGSSTLKQIGSIWGVKDELEKMNNTVLTIQAVLQDAEEQQAQNHQVEQWLKRLRDVVFDADDLLSEFSTHVFRREVMGGDKMAKKVEHDMDFEGAERREEESGYFEVQSKFLKGCQQDTGDDY